MAVEYCGSWFELRGDSERASLQRQYDLEISKNHQLWGQQGLVIGKNGATDDVMVQLADGCLAIVHLTWVGEPSDSYPQVILYRSASEASLAIAEDYHGADRQEF